MRLVLSIILIMLCSTVQANTRDGLIGWWALDEISGNAFDSSWKGGTGTPTGTTVVNNCARNNCRKFVNDYIQIPTVAGITTAVSASAWFKTSVTSSDGNILEVNDIGISRGVGQLYVTTGHKVRYYSDNSVPTTPLDCTGVTNVNDDKWHLAVMTYDSAVMRGYLDGVQDCSKNGTGGIGIGTDFTYIGKAGIAGSGLPFYYTGLVDDVRVYNRALTVQEIQDLYNSGVLIKGTATILNR